MLTISNNLLLCKMLARVCSTHQHELHQHVEHVGCQVHAGGVSEVLMEIGEGASSPQEVVHSLVQTLGSETVLFRSELGVERCNVEQDAGLLERNGALTTWYAC